MVARSVPSAAGLTLAFVCACASTDEAPSDTRPRVLVFDKCIVYCHASIHAGADAIRALGDESGFAVDVTDDAAVFTDARLAKYAALVFLSTTVENDDTQPFHTDPNPFRDGSIMDAEQKAAFERYITNGGGWVGVHAASDGDYRWPFYVDMVGAMFRDHPPAGTRAIARVEDPRHPSTADLPAAWTREEEWYNFKSNPRGKVHVLVTFDESSTDAQPKMGTLDHPVAWCRIFRGARVFYTAFGHAPETYAEPLFRAHLLGGIRWAAKLAPGDCGL